MKTLSVLPREAMLALDLPIELHGFSTTPSGRRTPVIVRFATIEARDAWLRCDAERAALALTPP